MNRQIDVSHALPAIHVPTLLIAKTEDAEFPIERMRRLTSQIAGARLVEMPGDEHFFWVGEYDSMVDEIERFVDEFRGQEAELERFLATVLFTDIVDSTATGASWATEPGRNWSRRITPVCGDSWRGSADARSTRRATASSRRSTGPDAAIRCAQAIISTVAISASRSARACTPGRCEQIGDKVGGIAVNIGARVAALAGPSEVLVSQTVKDLMAGSGLVFEDAGEHELKGVPDRWRLYRVVDGCNAS